MNWLVTLWIAACQRRALLKQEVEHFLFVICHSTTCWTSHHRLVKQKKDQNLVSQASNNMKSSSSVRIRQVHSGCTNCTNRSLMHRNQPKKRFQSNFLLKRNLAPAAMRSDAAFLSPSATAAWRRDPPCPPYWQFTASLERDMSL